jgi:hypothetical protein
MMKRWRLWLLLLVACGAPAAAVVSYAPPYANNDLVLLTAYRAKDMCSCLFVMNMSEEYCADWTVASPNIATYAIDRQAKAVTTSALVFWGARAHYEGGPPGPTGYDYFGCILDN